MSKLALSLSVITAVCLGVVTPTYAQTQPRADSHATGTILMPTWETSAGYQLLHVPDQTFPFGLNVDGARNFGPWGIAAEAGWSFDKSDDVTYNVFNFGAGPRWTARSKASIWPFAQVLAGLVYSRASTDVVGLNLSDSTTRFMLQPGAGAVFLAGDGWGIVGQVDYRRVFLDEDKDGESGQNDFRVFVGVRFILD
jgi:hypothetical protein